MEDSIFTKIIKGEAPCHKIYEDESTIAFLNIYPRLPGHTLVIPKQQIEFVWDLPEDLYRILMTHTRKIALHIREKSDSKHMHMGVVGVDVPHAHIHLIPFDNSDDLSHDPDTSAEPDHAALAEMAAKLRLP